MSAHTIGGLILLGMFILVMIFWIGYKVGTKDKDVSNPSNPDECVNGKASDNWWIDKQ